MLQCAKQLTPCSGKAGPDPPICPTPPKKPFPWIYPLLLGLLVSLLGLFYKYYIYSTDDEGWEKQPWRPRRKQRRPPYFEDLPRCVQYLIVGTGAAGWAAYRAIMRNDEKAKVFFITKEDVFPYRRPPMSKWMWYNGEPPEFRTLNYVANNVRKTMYNSVCKTFMDPVKFYRKPTGPALSIAYGYCVLRVDPDNHVAYVKTPCGEKPVYYERCLLAPGAYAKNLSFYKHSPKFVREKIQTFRTLRDLERAYVKVRESKHVTIIGGGPLACELAWYMARMHHEWIPAPPEDWKPPEILMMYKDKGVLSHLLPEYLGEWAAEKIRCQGVSLMPKCQVYDAFETKDGRLQLTLSNGKSIVTDYVLVAIGTAPRVDIAERSDLEIDPINKGFLVNTELEARTHLYVAGDAASIWSQWKNVRLRMEHFLNAEEQGFIAGANMTGYWFPCNMEPYFWFELGNDISAEVIGEIGACLSTVGLFKPCDEIESDEETKYEKSIGEYDRPCFKETASYRNRYKRGIVFYLRNDIVVGIIFWNMGNSIEDRKEVATEILRARPSYKDINLLAELLGFDKMECVYIPPPATESFICIDKSVSNWLEYEEYDKMGALSKVETPETVVWKNNPL